MKRALGLIPLFMLAALLSAGCYTKFYRPGMEMAGHSPYETLYNRNDSTAIDTTLTQDTSQYYDTYPNTYPDTRWNSWSYWGRPRGYTRWGFDFNNFSPDYYWSYYGYYDYYGTPWWYDWYRPWYGNYYPGGTGAPGEPPSRRPGGGRQRDDTGSYAQPAPSSSGSPALVQPSNPNPPPPTSRDGNTNKNSGSDNKGKTDPNKPGGGRGR